MKLSVIVPVYNERKTIKNSLERIKASCLSNFPDWEIVVVDDGSTDGTREILSSQRDEKVKIIHHQKNLGKGAAIKTALQHITGDIVLIQDADLEYDPGQYPELIEPIISQEAEVVYGSRFLGNIKGMRAVNWVANKILTFTVNLLFRASITDEATCYKVFRAEVLRNLNLRARGFEFCPEVTAKLLKRGYKIYEVPINYQARKSKEGKKVGWRDGFVALYTLIKYRFLG